MEHQDFHSISPVELFIRVSERSNSRKPPMNSEILPIERSGKSYRIVSRYLKENWDRSEGFKRRTDKVFLYSTAMSSK
ncbi:hypothetical protein AYI70_g110 [Smittium culicis]|uniref:Uncharacterized protein n=1 Tax=Smittium culicis TaxID=133412 RepID=A0A1R1YHW3_9FUNG|nr:hypothetical protein AYI70_g110 [Smittium culicis]